MRARVQWVGVLAVAAGSACAGAKQETAPAAAPQPTTCARHLDPATTPKPLGLPRVSSTVALATLGDKTLAYIADEDDQTVRVADVDGKEIASIPLDGRPSQLMFTADGRLLVAIRDKAEIEVLEPTAQAGTLEKRCVAPTDAEPIAMASSPDDAKLYVSTGWGRSLSGYDAKAADMARGFTLALPREPRAVAVSNDGARAFVSHAVGGDISVVDLDKQRVLSVPTHPTDDLIQHLRKKAQAAKASFSAPSFSRGMTGSACQGFALARLEMGPGRIFAPQVLVDPGDPNTRPSGYGSSHNELAEVADVAVLDGSSGDVLLPSLEPVSEQMSRMTHGSNSTHADACILPRAAAFDKESGTLFVTCLGIDDVIAYDGLAASPARAEKHRWDVAAGPTGIAIDGPKHRAIVWSQFEHVLNAIPFGGSELVDEKSEKVAKVTHIAMPLKTPMPLAYELGRVLFHSVGDPRVSKDGRACASCHPDGRDDSLTWATPNGPRRSITLAGRVGATAPFSWSGTEDTLKDHMSITFDRLKGDGGLRSMELEALAQYVMNMTPPPAPKVTSPKIAKGAEIFNSKATGCATCHAGEHTTDNNHHDVQSKNAFDRGGEFNTPSLRFVGNGGPYFHDGRYKTLRQLLTDADRKMGYTKHLSDEDLEALEAYLRSL